MSDQGCGGASGTTLSYPAGWTIWVCNAIQDHPGEDCRHGQRHGASSPKAEEFDRRARRPASPAGLSKSLENVWLQMLPVFHCVGILEEDKGVLCFQMSRFGGCGRVKRRWTSLAGTAHTTDSEQVKSVKGCGDGLMEPSCRWITPHGAVVNLTVAGSRTASSYRVSRTNINGQIRAVKTKTRGFVKKGLYNII